VPAQPAKSTLSSSLASLRRTATSKPVLPRAPRSSSFAERLAPMNQSQIPAGPSRSSEVEDELEVGEPGRSDDLTILEGLKPGPKEFGRDPEGEESWLHLEPNTKIRLSCVIIF
jgi:minichromosome maintenance protein 10